MNQPISIPDFTAEEYTTTSLPYEWLYQYKNDKFTLQQLVQQMKQKATSVGVKCFVSLWKAYRETIAKKNGEILDNSTQFDGQTLELFSGQYICDESGVYTIDRFGYQVSICCHPIMPVKRYINADSGEERLELAYKKGNVWHSRIIEKSVIASSSSILQLAAFGVVVNSENAKALSTYLLEIENMNYNQIPEEISIGRLGWISGNRFAPYVDDLTFDGENNFRHIFSSIKSAGDRGAWVQAMRSVRAEHTPGRFFLAASFASVLLEPCGLLPFFLHAWGTTETGKTVGLMLAASVWACPRMGDYITTFNSTSVGQEMTASFLNSLPMCIDELQIKSAAGQKDFDSIIYQLTEGVGKTRGAKTGGLQRQTTWKNCIITSGEHPLSRLGSGGGAVNRIIEFECDKKIYSDLVALCSVIQKNYGWAGREFVNYLQQPGTLDHVIEVQKKYYSQLLDKDSTEKLAASASAILTADELVTDLIFKDGNNLSVSDLTAILTKKKEVDVNYRALEFIHELVVRNPTHFQKNGYGDYQGEVWGKIDDDGMVYIIKSVYDQQMMLAGFNGTSFLSWAKRTGNIDCDSGKRTKKSRINGAPTNTVCLLPISAEELSDDDELPL